MYLWPKGCITLTKNSSVENEHELIYGLMAIEMQECLKLAVELLSRHAKHDVQAAKLIARISRLNTPNRNMTGLLDRVLSSSFLQRDEEGSCYWLEEEGDRRTALSQSFLP